MLSLSSAVQGSEFSGSAVRWFSGSVVRMFTSLVFIVVFRCVAYNVPCY